MLQGQSQAGRTACRLQTHEQNRMRLERLRAARVQAAQRQLAITRQRFWLAMLWASSAQGLLGRVRLTPSRSPHDSHAALLYPAVFL